MPLAPAGLRPPKLRSGSYFPDWLLERRRRAERALTTVVATCYLLGVSTRRMEKPVETLRPTGRPTPFSQRRPWSCCRRGPAPPAAAPPRGDRADPRPRRRQVVMTGIRWVMAG